MGEGVGIEPGSDDAIIFRRASVSLVAYIAPTHEHTGPLEIAAELALPLLALAAQLVRCPASTNGAFATCSNSPIKALGDAQGSCGHAHRRWCRRGSEPCGRARTLCMNVHAEQSIRTGHDKSLCMMIFSLCVCTCTHVAATPALTEQPRI